MIVTIFEHSCIDWKRKIDQRKNRQKEIEDEIRNIANDDETTTFAEAVEHIIANALGEKTIKDILDLVAEYYEIDGEVKAAARLARSTNEFMQDTIVSNMILHGGSKYVS